MDAATLITFAARYTAAWCSHNAANVAACFAEAGSLAINNGAPSVGRSAIAAAAQSFMTGTSTGPGGTRNPVRISGYEEWRIGPDGLIAESKGHFDAADYRRQLESGAPPDRR